MRKKKAKVKEKGKNKAERPRDNWDVETLDKLLGESGPNDAGFHRYHIVEGPVPKSGGVERVKLGGGEYEFEVGWLRGDDGHVYKNLDSDTACMTLVYPIKSEWVAV